MQFLKQLFSGGALCAVLLVGCTPIPQTEQSQIESARQTVSSSERLGTQWGDDVTSSVTTVQLQRTSSTPVARMQVIYANKRFSGRSINSIALLAGKVAFSVQTDNATLPLYREVDQYYLQGREGQAYRLVYENNSTHTYEVVTSVDGINVINGKAASQYDHGYVLPANGRLVIEGFRKSQDAVASFIFSKPQQAYAANIVEGSIDNTGVIGTVFYELYDPAKPKARTVSTMHTPQAFPADNGYAKPPR